MSWDDKRAAGMVGKTVVLRLILVDEDAEEGAVPPRAEQRGTIVSADDGGFTVRGKDGAEFTIPPELDALDPVADPGPGEADFVSLWTVVGHGTGSEAWTPGDAAPSTRPPRRSRPGGEGPEGGAGRRGRGGGPGSGPGRKPVRGPGGGRGRR